MQPNERMLSSCDVTGLVKNSLFLCVRSAPCTRRHFYRLFGVFTAFATLAAPLIKDPSAPNVGRNDNAPPRFAVGNIRFFIIFFVVFFVVFFLIVFLGFMPMPILVLVFIAAHTAAAAALSLRAESLAVTRASALSYVSRTCTSTRNRCNSQSINISKICLHLSTKSITFSNNSDVVPPSEARPNSIFIFDDVVCDKQDAVREYFSMGVAMRTSTASIFVRRTRGYLNI
ncbi:hypothetical protein ALC57_04448 [Trachymyrmex cornetzi]|uniref:Uncharacterized protein n=1 Tax=Trachymyrmex cornetzi TaxID=471704 RepID=A0A151JC75_9HYME|nr:hypothetical protein ALC57_04448 [Trachymyrmex cornetzi]